MSRAVIGVAILLVAATVGLLWVYGGNGQPAERLSVTPVPLEEREGIAARIDEYTPNTPVRAEAGRVIPVTVTFTNTGAKSWPFVVGLSSWDCDGRITRDISVPLQREVKPGEKITVEMSYIVPQGPQGLQVGIWKGQPFILENLLARAPSPYKILIVGGDGPSTC